jgi:plastocyanin
MWSPSNVRNTPLGIVFGLLSATSGAAFAAGVDANVMDAAGAPVADAVIYALPASPKPPSAPRAAIIDQIDKEYVPFVVPVQAGAAVRFPNKDNIRHHVYSFSPAKPFELKLYSGTPSKPVIFDKPGPVALGCNIHDWMVGYIYVVDSPWFAKTDKSGIAKLEGLPAGEYQVRVWHPWMKAEPAPLALKLGEANEGAAFRMEIVIPPKISRAEK